VLLAILTNVKKMNQYLLSQVQCLKQAEDPEVQEKIRQAQEQVDVSQGSLPYKPRLFSRPSHGMGAKTVEPSARPPSPGRGNPNP
jgi:hypothetical protein